MDFLEFEKCFGTLIIGMRTRFKLVHVQGKINPFFYYRNGKKRGKGKREKKGKEKEHGWVLPNLCLRCQTPFKLPGTGELYLRWLGGLAPEFISHYQLSLAILLSVWNSPTLVVCGK